MAVYHNATCPRCSRSWTKQLNGQIACPSCTNASSVTSDVMWLMLWSFMFGLGLGSIVTYQLTRQDQAPVVVEEPDAH